MLRQQLIAPQSDTRSAGLPPHGDGEILADQVFVFTPKGGTHDDLSAGSTPVDFAYRIHSDLVTTVSAPRSAAMVPIDYRFSNGDVVQIGHAKHQRPQPGLAQVCQDLQGAQPHHGYLRRLTRDEEMPRAGGAARARVGAKESGADRPSRHERAAEVAAEMNYQSVDDLLAAVGHARERVHKVVERLTPQPVLETPIISVPVPRALEQPAGKIGITVCGQEGLS